MNTSWLLGWWNLIFVVPFGLSLVYLGVYTMSGWTFGDADADLDADHDLDVDHDVDIEHDVDVDANVDVDADHDVAIESGADVHADADTDTDSNSASDGDADLSAGLWAALNWLGVGRVPLSILLMLFLLSWGVIGFLTNQILQRAFASVLQLAAASSVVAFAGSLLVSATVARGFERWLPLNVSNAKRRHGLLGSDARAVLPISAEFGLASVRDEDSGELFQVPCRLQSDSPSPLQPGAVVRLVGYSARERLYYVKPSEHVHN